MRVTTNSDPYLPPTLKDSGAVVYLSHEWSLSNGPVARLPASTRGRFPLADDYQATVPVQQAHALDHGSLPYQGIDLPASVVLQGR